MSILAFEPTSTKRKTVRSMLSEILMSGNVPIDETSQPVWRVRCLECGWKFELGGGVHPDIGTARARVHRQETGHTNIRKRFDLFDCDAGPVERKR